MKSERPWSKWVPCVLVGFSSVAVVLPIVMARRAKKINMELRSGPPVRSISNKSSMRPLNMKQSAMAATEAVEKPSYISILVQAIAALGVSTLLVGGSSFAGIYIVRSSWGVNTIPEFSKRMRNEISNRFPGFTKVIESSLRADISENEVDDHTLDEWDYDASKERLMKAFNEGGLSRLGEVAWEEIQMESQFLLRKRRRE